MKLDEAIENNKHYELGYRHGMLSMQEMVEGLQARLLAARAEVQRLQEVIIDRRE